MGPHVLLVDDDTELLELLQHYLQGDGFTVSTRHDGVSGVEAALSGDFALVVLDVMMPGLSGIEALARIRAQSQVPVLMLTAKGDDADRILGLELGADDYVPKPCTPRELAARIRAILRRSPENAPSPQEIRYGALALQPDRRLATWAGRPVELTSTEYSLVEVLARHGGKVVSKGILSTEGLGRALSRFDRSIDVHMSSIRQKLGQVQDGRSCIQTVFRKGYQLIRD